ncbi:MAG: endolytic transglycosylase MltG [Anaerolineae bacterium]
MERSFRTLVLLFLALGIMALICGGLLFLLAGDGLIDAGRILLIRASLVFRQDELDQPIGTDDTIVRFVVDPGDTARTIAAKLQTSGLIADSELFVDYARSQSLDSELEAGIFFLRQTQSTRQIAQALTDSRFSEITFSITPGQRLEEVVAQIDSNPLFGFTGQDFLNVVGRGAPVDPTFAQVVGLPQGMSLEGFLFPDTYALRPDITPEGLRDLLLQAFLTNTETIRQQTDGYSVYEIVTLASIIEREAIHNDEKPTISSAYRNRLETPGWRLDADPTVQYALGTPENWWPRITVADYALQAVYNTYQNPGLPPGPIANPGLSALDAAANPAETPYYFFRADCRSDGYHDFAVTYEEHLANGC